VDIVSQFQLDIYSSAKNAGYLPWLWLTLVVIAPIGEETLFRGFLFRGWYRVPLDVWPVIIVTSSIWALSHVQYDLFHGPSIRERAGARMASVDLWFHHPDHAAAWPPQL
jgi:membrane protease YdiL (CAAX protease family)